MANFEDVAGDLGLVWGLHPDQSRFLVTRRMGDGGEEPEGSSPRLVVVTNWFTELRRRMGGVNGN